MISLINCPKKQNSKKMKQTPGDIVLHICIKAYDQMMNGSWDTVHNQWMDRWMDRKSDIQMWVLHQKKEKNDKHLAIFFF